MKLELDIVLRTHELGASIRAIDASRLTVLRVYGQPGRWGASASVLGNIGHLIVAAAPFLRELDLICHGKIEGPDLNGLSFPCLQTLGLPGECIATGGYMESLLLLCKHIESLTIYRCDSGYQDPCLGQGGASRLRQAAKADLMRSKLCSSNAGSLKTLVIPSPHVARAELAALAEAGAPNLAEVRLAAYRGGSLAQLPATLASLSVDSTYVETVNELALDLANPDLRDRLPDLKELHVSRWRKVQPWESVEDWDRLELACKEASIAFTCSWE